MALVEVDGPVAIPQDAPYLCATVIDGTGSANGHEVAKGASFIVPATVEALSLDGAMRLIMSHQ